MQETGVRSLGKENLLEKEMATHTSILAQRIPWTEEPGRLQSMGSQRVGHHWATKVSLSFTPCLLLELKMVRLNLEGLISTPPPHRWRQMRWAVPCQCHSSWGAAGPQIKSRFMSLRWCPFSAHSLISGCNSSRIPLPALVLGSVTH